MSFDHYFVRISCERLDQESEKFLDLNISPEVYMDSCSLNSFSRSRVRRTGDILSKFRANTLHAPFLDISTGGYDDDIRDLSFRKLSRVIELGKIWGSELVVVHYNYDRLYYRQSLKKWMDRSVDFFRRLVSVPGIPLIAIENIDDPTPDVAVELIKRTGSDRMIHCFDYGHHHVFGKIGSTEWLQVIGSEGRIHFHFHDNDGSGDDHLPMGEGKIDWTKARTDIAATGMDFSVTLEPHSEESMIRSLEFYRKNFTAGSR